MQRIDPVDLVKTSSRKKVKRKKKKYIHEK